MADDAPDYGQQQQHVETSGRRGRIPRRFETYRQRIDRTFGPGDVVAVTHVEPVGAGRQVGERELRRRAGPLVVVAVQTAVIAVVAAVHVVERRDRDLEDALSVSERQHAVAGEHVADVADAVVEPDVAEQHRGIVLLLAEARILDGHQSVDAAEEEGARPRVGETGPVAVFDGVQSVRIAVGHHVARVGRVLHQTAVGAQPEVALAVFENAVHGVADARNVRGRIPPEFDQPAAGAEPHGAVAAAVDGEDVVGDGAAPRVELEDFAAAAGDVVADCAAAAVAEPHRRTVFGVEREEEVLDLQFVVEMQLLDPAYRGLRRRAAQRHAEYAAAHRGHPQRVGRSLVQGVYVFERRRGAERADAPVVVRIVVQSFAVGADPEQVASAAGEGVDRIVEQLAVVGRELLHMRRGELLAVVEVGDAQDAFAFGADPERPLVVDVERADGFREVVGQLVEGDRAERRGVARMLVESLSVGADPYDLLPGVAQQRKDAAGDVDVLGGVFHALFGRGAQPYDAVGIERDDVVAAVADDARHAAHARHLVVHLLDVDQAALPDVEFVEYVIFVDEEAAAVFGERVFGIRDRGEPFGLSDADPVVVFVRECDRYAEDSFAGEYPQGAVVVQLHVEDVGVVDAGHGLYGAEPARRRVVTAEFVVLRDDEHLVAAPCHDFVHSLEVRMAFDPLAVGVEEIQSVVGADPEERVRGDGDLLNEIS